MNTVKEVTKATLSSPRALAAVVGVLLPVFAVVSLILRSEALFDDILFALICAVIVFELYVMHDWFINAVQRYLCPEDVIFKIPVRQRLAALTIDDVPLLNNPTHLKDLLDVLRENKVKATLMIMSGFDVDSSKGGMKPKDRKRCRALLQQAVADGHELGNHLQFDKPAIAMKPEDFEHAFDHCDKLIADLHGGQKAWQGRPRRWFRPAAALWNQHILACARKKGYTTAITNCYPWDHMQLTRHINPAYLAQRVRPGAIVVLHDRWHTPQTLRRALPMILSSGMKLGTLSDLQAASDAEAAEQYGAKQE